MAAKDLSPITPPTLTPRCAGTYSTIADAGLADARRLLAMARDLEVNPKNPTEYADQVELLLEAVDAKLEEIQPEIENLRALAMTGRVD